MPSFPIIGSGLSSIFVTNGTIFAAVQAVATQITQLTTKVNAMGITISAELAVIQNAIMGIATSVSAVAMTSTAIITDLNNIAAAIAALKSSKTSVLSPDDQAMLDAIDAAATSGASNAATMQTNAAAVQAQADALAAANPPPVGP